MSSAASWSYTSKATLWAAGARDAWGGAQTFAAPVVIACDYKATSELRRDANGEEFTSRLVIYTEATAKPGDFILIGESTNTNPIAAGAEKVRSVGRYADTFENIAEDFEIVT
jgi:hypothetical protein